MMESQCSRGAASSESESESESESDFGFAFNNPNFSDRLLRIEIIPDEQALNGNQPDEDTVGEFAANNNDSMDYAAALVPVKTLHISSSILATKSPFFYKLLFYGMSDSEQRDATLRINASEEVVLMDLLKFMYSNTLNIAAPPAPALVELLIAADKFEVTSCVRYCSQLLQNLPMTLDSALLYLDLPHTILTTDAVQPLIDAAKQYLVCRYKDITKSKKEAMALPLSGIEAILASDDLQVGSEDVVYDFVLKWARQHYNSLYERMEVLGTRLARLIRFPYMTCQKLEKVLTCIDFRLASKLVREAFFFKAEAQQSLGADASLNCGFVERAYKWRPVKVVEFELPREQCVVYMDLKRDEIATLFPFGRVKSQEFHLGGQMFFLFGECSRDNNNPSHHFAMGVGMRSKCLGSIVVDYEFAARSRPAKEEFLRQYKTHKTFTGGTCAGRNLFGVPWSEFMAEDYPFFINGVLHLKAVLTIRG